MQQPTAPPPQQNILVFILLTLLILLGYWQFRSYLFPPPAPIEPGATVAGPSGKPKQGDPRIPAPLPVTPASELLYLGAADDEDVATFPMKVSFDPLGAGVRHISLNRFRAALPSGKPDPDHLLDLIPAAANLHEPSFLLYHFAQKDISGEHPVETLGRRKWEVIKTDGKGVARDEVDGKARQSVSFATEIDGVRVTKTYSLVAGEYHLGLEVTMQRPKLGINPKESDKQPTKFRYQLTGAKGLPVEGKWYTSTFRNSLIALEDDRGYIYRDFQELRQISNGMGGHAIDSKEEKYLRYAGVAVQYFASVIVVDENQKDWRFLQRARPTLETGVLRGRVKPGTLDQTDRVVLISDDGKTESIAYLPPRGRATRDLYEQRFGLREGAPVAVLYQNAGYDEKLKECPRIASAIRVGGEAEATHSLWEDDITVRVSTHEVKVAPGAKVTHRYLLYNGPVKTSLLGQLRGEAKVSDEVVDRYIDTLKLNTLTDYQSNGPMGTFAHTIGWTYLVIKSTNVMHWVLGKMHLVLPSYGLSIIFLTLLVRAMMFPLSRKQAMMTLKMAALQPQLKVLQEKHKDDKQAYATEQMRVFRENGVNPFGSCWVLLLQMPIFMGLYFSLQESITFRLADFWPTWITNLAAPDMMVEWGKNIPLLSRDADYGGLIYLGPYFNLLPIFTVAFMVIQQKIMTPPPTNKEQEVQQKMMRFMMLFFGLFFYKMASGLCIYIITSTLWGFAERLLLPKVKKLQDKDAPPTSEATALALGGRPGDMAVTSGVGSQGAGRKPGKSRRKGGRPAKEEKPEPTSGIGKLRQQLNDWWIDVLEKAKKK